MNSKTLRWRIQPAARLSPVGIFPFPKCLLASTLVFCLGVTPLGWSTDQPSRREPRGKSTKSAGDADRAETGDVLTLLEHGSIEAEWVAHGAYRVEGKIRNRTNGSLTVTFPPGLVADAWAQNVIYAQIGGGGGGGSGGQGLGFLDSNSYSIPGGGEVLASFRTACLNFGVPEPTRRTMVYLKSVAEYSSNPALKATLEQIAAGNVPTLIAQAALWHTADRMPWDQLAKLNVPGLGAMSRQIIGQAELLVNRARGTMPNDGRSQNATSGGLALPARPRFDVASREAVIIALNPDKRGTVVARHLLPRLTKRLRDQLPGVEVSARNYLPASGLRTGAVQFNYVIGTQANTVESVLDKPIYCLAQRSDWDRRLARWQHDRLTSTRWDPSAEPNRSRTASSLRASKDRRERKEPPQDADRTESKDSAEETGVDVPAAASPAPIVGEKRSEGSGIGSLSVAKADPVARIAERILADIAERAVQVQWASGGKKRRLVLTNRLPIALKSVVIRDARAANSAPVELAGLQLAAGGTTTITLEPEQQERLASAARLTSCALILADR